MSTTPGSPRSRPSVDEYFLSMCQLVARRGTCCRRQVGCVLVDKHNHVLATGYNGVPAGHVHCIDVPCPGASAPSGTGLNLCQAIHAEDNALRQCTNIFKIRTLYCTASPCILCMEKIVRTAVTRIVFIERYPHVQSENVARDHGIEWAQCRAG